MEQTARGGPPYQDRDTRTGGAVGEAGGSCKYTTPPPQNKKGDEAKHGDKNHKQITTKNVRSRRKHSVESRKVLNKPRGRFGEHSTIKLLLILFIAAWRDEAKFVHLTPNRLHVIWQ